MPYSPREALTVALYNANIEPLHQAFDLADEVLSGLRQMGFEIKDIHHTRDLDCARAFVTKAALRALPDLP